MADQEMDFDPRDRYSNLPATPVQTIQPQPQQQSMQFGSPLALEAYNRLQNTGQVPEQLQQNIQARQNLIDKSQALYNQAASGLNQAHPFMALIDLATRGRFEPLLKSAAYGKANSQLAASQHLAKQIEPYAKLFDDVNSSQHNANVDWAAAFQKVLDANAQPSEIEHRQAEARQNRAQAALKEVDLSTESALRNAQVQTAQEALKQRQEQNQYHYGRALAQQAAANAAINNYLATHGGGPLKLQGEQLGNEEKQLLIKKYQQDLSKGPEQKLTPAQNLHINQLNRDLNEAQANHKSLRAQINKYQTAVKLNKDSKDPDVQVKMKALQDSLPDLIQQMHDEENKIATTKALQDRIVTPVNVTNKILARPPEAGQANVDDQGNPMTLYEPPKPVTVAGTNALIPKKRQLFAIFSDNTGKYSQQQKDDAHAEYLSLLKGK